MTTVTPNTCSACLGECGSDPEVHAPLVRNGANDMRYAEKSRTYRARRAALSTLACLFVVTACLPSPALAEGVGRVLRPITRSVADQRRIIQGSEVSRRVVRPKLGIVRGKEAGGVTSLSLNGDSSLLFVVLADGTSRFWDLDRGVQLGGVIGRRLLTGVVGGSGEQSEAVAVDRDGSVMVIRPDGSAQRNGRAAEPLGRKPSVVLSGNGKLLAFRATAGWRVVAGGRTFALTDAASAFLPLLSPDGTWVVYVTDRGAVVARNTANDGAVTAARLGNCVRKVALTAGAFFPGRQPGDTWGQAREPLRVGGSATGKRLGAACWPQTCSAESGRHDCA